VEVGAKRIVIADIDQIAERVNRVPWIVLTPLFPALALPENLFGNLASRINPH